MNHYCDEWVREWCDQNGWTDLFTERFKQRLEYWAFPPNAVMPLPVPTQALRTIKQEKGLSQDERWWTGAAMLAALTGAVLGYAMSSPMPLVAAFAFCAMTVARLEVEDC